MIEDASPLPHGSNHIVESEGSQKLVNNSGLAADDEDPNLPPIDGGPGAWRFILGAFMMEAFQWGKSFNPQSSERLLMLDTRLCSQLRRLPRLLLRARAFPRKQKPRNRWYSSHWRFLHWSTRGDTFDQAFSAMPEAHGLDWLGVVGHEPDRRKLRNHARRPHHDPRSHLHCRYYHNLLANHEHVE